MAKRSGAEVLAEMLQGYGVTHVFMVPPFRPPPDAEHARAALDAIEAAGRPAVIDVVSDIDAFAPLAVVAGGVGRLTRRATG